MDRVAYTALKRESMHHVEIISVPPETFVQKVVLFNTFTSELSKEKKIKKQNQQYLIKNRLISNAKSGDTINTQKDHLEYHTEFNG